jgi:uncharacterized protein with HEPN domain
MNVPVRQARYLWEILFYSREIQAHLTDYSIDRYLADRKTQQAVERCLEIIGEASTKLDEKTVQLFPGLPVSEMRAMRNFLIHTYFQIDPRRSVGDFPAGYSARHRNPGSLRKGIRELLLGGRLVTNT